MKWINKIYPFLGDLKLAFSLYVPFLFLFNYDIAILLFPYEFLDEKFIAMDEFRHGAYAAIIFMFAYCGVVKTVHRIGDLFLYFGFFLAFFDVVDRFLFHITERILLDLISIVLSLAFSILIYVGTNRDREVNP